jgi:hypothetical protein
MDALLWKVHEMDDFWTRIVGNMADRVSGPMQFRFVLQPIVASIFAIYSGLKDAKSNKPPYFWGILTHRDQRADMLKDGWKSIGKVFILALVLDIAYQVLELHYIYPDEALIVGLILAIAPYLILRGLVNRVASRK